MINTWFKMSAITGIPVNSVLKIYIPAISVLTVLFLRDTASPSLTWLACTMDQKGNPNKITEKHSPVPRYTMLILNFLDADADAVATSSKTKSYTRRRAFHRPWDIIFYHIRFQL